MSKAFTSSNPEAVPQVVAVIPVLGCTSMLAVTAFAAAEVQALHRSNEMALKLLDDLRTELAETRADRDRAWGRVKVLESRLSSIRLVVR